MRKLTTKIFIEKVKIIHNNKYSYSDVTYINNRTKIKIYCNNCNSVFYQTPNAHLLGQGCPKCCKNLNTTIFVEKAYKKHKGLYDYSKVVYTASKNNVTIICNNCGKEFQQSANSHLRGNGCKHCNRMKYGISLQTPKKQFLDKVNTIHNNKYSYDLTNYNGVANSIITITCPEHGKFQQNARIHLRSGCPKCVVKGFKRTKWITKCQNNINSNPETYIIRCFNTKEEFIKIGITQYSLSRRFAGKKSLPYSYEILKEFKGSPDFVWDKEKELHKKFKNYKYMPKIHFNGYTECFSSEILQFLNL